MNSKLSDYRRFVFLPHEQDAILNIFFVYQAPLGILAVGRDPMDAFAFDRQCGQIISPGATKWHNVNGVYFW